MAEEQEEEETIVPLYKRVRAPTVIQMEAVECGAASLAIILGYHKRYVTLEELRIACGISRDGSNLLNMKRAAEDFGLSCKVYKKSMEELMELEPPFIVFWGYDHFLVVEGFNKREVFLNDPASGPRKVTHEQFQDKYSGVVMTLEKTPEFKEGGSLPSIWPGVIQRLKRVQPSIVFLLVSGFCIMLTGAIYPGFTKIFFDTILGKSVYNWSNWFIVGLSALTVLTGGLIGLQQYLLLRLNGKLSIIFSSEYLTHILKLPLSFYQQRFGGEIAYRLSLNDEVINALTGTFATSIISVVFILLYGVVMFLLNPEIAAIAVIAAILNLLTIIWIQRVRNDTYALLQQDFGKYTGFAIGGLYYIESIKAGGAEHDFFAKLIGYFNRSIVAKQKLDKKESIATTIPVFLQLLTTTALFGIGGWMMMKGDFSIGLFIAMQMLISSFMTPVMQLMSLGTTVQTVKIDMSRIDDVMKNPVDPMFLQEKDLKSEALIEKPQLEGYLEFKDVTFGYSPLDPPLINGLSFSLKPGQRIALVGPTGCGKTTIAKLISGLISPWQGKILYDGKERLELTRQQIVNSLSTIDQDLFLFAGTIKDNLTLFDKTVSEEEIVQAAKDASFHDEIVQKSGGYNYLLTEGGSNLSGGQKQRVEIARGLLLNPRILILDEATSSLDSKTEEQIIKNIRQRGCTCLMVAHRLSSIRDCDEIIVLEKGQVVQRGTHDYLKSIPGTYRDLVLSDI